MIENNYHISKYGWASNMIDDAPPSTALLNIIPNRCKI